MPIWGCLPGSPCHRAGVIYGDILLEVNGKKTDSVEAYIEAKELDPEEFRVRFLRGGDEVEVCVPLVDPDWDEITSNPTVVRSFFHDGPKDLD